MIIALIIACLLLGTIFLQDITSRSIWWFLPPLLFGTFIVYRWTDFSWMTLGFNIAFIALLMAFLFVYIRFRFGNPELFFKQYFGLGDLLFILALTPLLSFQHFILFFTIGTFSTLLIHGIILLFKKQATIPYAGYFSLVTLAYLLLLQSGTDVFHFIQV
ncbi:MAG TPA: prepilin peptidase [Fluviicola sp.]|nr:prepilin peptidase [Fluviicola sp.]